MGRAPSTRAFALAQDDSHQRFSRKAIGSKKSGEPCGSPFPLYFHGMDLVCVGRLAAVEQHAILLLFAHRTVEQLSAFAVDLNERRPRGNRALDQRLAERVLDVLL